MHDHDLLFLEEDPVAGKGLGRSIVHHDPRSRGFAIRPLLEEQRRSRIWWRRGVFDQGSTSSCVGQSVMGLVNTTPFRTGLVKNLLQYDPIFLYRTAQKQFDPWPGEEPSYYGTSTLAGFKAAQAAGLIREYRWCFGLADVVDTLATFGPVVIGVNWYSSFDRTGYDGRLRITQGATPRGGHAVELVSVNFTEKTVRGVNSWGTSWGSKGRFELEFSTLERLLNEEGEAATAIL